MVRYPPTAPPPSSVCAAAVLARWCPRRVLGAGCSFLEQPCYDLHQALTTSFPTYFCNNQSTYACTFDHTAKGQCMLSLYSQPLQPWWQYFSNANIGGSTDVRRPLPPSIARNSPGAHGAGSVCAPYTRPNPVPVVVPGLQLNDYCPFITPYLNATCNDPLSQPLQNFAGYAFTKLVIPHPLTLLSFPLLPFPPHVL